MQLPLAVRSGARNIPSIRLGRVSWTAVLVVFTLVVAGVAHAYNMSGFPSYFQDEGVYQSQGWQVFTDSITPYSYTYWYDHPPAGWIFSGLWMKLTGGFYTFGNSLDTGRVFVLVLHLASVFMLFWITKRITRSSLAAAAAALLFALSPYWIIQGRQLMLEPIGVFWLLAAMIPLFAERPKLMGFWLSALFFGLAILTKESFIAFAPGFLLLVWLRAHKDHLVMAVAQWITIAGSMVSFYPLYAVLKGELLPEGWPLAAGGEHVSLIGTLQFHMSREQDAGLLDLNSRFWSNSVAHWFDLDPFLTVATPLCLLAGLVLGFRKRILWAFSLLILGFVLFLGRGGVVFDFYALPLVPIVALVVAVAAHEVVGGGIRLLRHRTERTASRGFRNRRGGLSTARRWAWVSLYAVVFLGLVTVGGVAALNHGSYERWYQAAFSFDNTSPQTQAVAWVRENVPRDDLVMINSYALLEVRTHPRTYWYWKVERDPEIRDDILHRNWRRVDYAIVTPNMEEEARSGVIPFVDEIMSHGKVVGYFSSDGYWVKVLRIESPAKPSVHILGSRLPDRSAELRLQPNAPPEASGQAATISRAAPWISSPPITTAEAAAEPAPTPAGDDDPFTVHTVVRGDTLSEIGENFGIVGIDWISIYLLNTTVIGDDADLILPAQRLKIPAGRRQ